MQADEEGTVERTRPEAPRQRFLAFEQCSNFRDLGGYPVGAGRQTRWGLLYRSGLLHGLTAGDLEAFGRLGIRAVFDLRSSAERDMAPSPVHSVHVPLADETSLGALAAMFAATSAQAAEDALVASYLGTLERKANVLAALLGQLCERANLPAVFHCTAGKDRTGLVAALVLAGLGVDRDAVVEDYAATARVPAPDAETYRPALSAAGVPAEAIDVLLGATPGSMARVLDELDRRYGAVEGYLLGPGAMAPATLGRLRDLLTEPAGE